MKILSAKLLLSKTEQQLKTFSNPVFQSRYSWQQVQLRFTVKQNEASAHANEGRQRPLLSLYDGFFSSFSFC